MNAPSTTATAGLSFGWLAAILMGLLAVFFPEQYKLIPPGFEAGLATGIGFVAAWRIREKRYNMSPRDPNQL